MDRALERVYDRLPRMECKGLCWFLCDGSFYASARERQRIAQKAGGPLKVDPTRGLCSMLDEHGRCSVYELRPLMCRIWGMTERFRCPHGCIPEGGFISESRKDALFREIDRIGGVPRDAEEKSRRARVDKEHLKKLWLGLGENEALEALHNRRLPLSASRLPRTRGGSFD
jgi:Fe-S-cluster containining protein